MDNKWITEKVDSRRLLLAGAAVALLYAVCFSGTQVLPQISFTLFCPAAFLLLTATLKSMHYFKNKKALWWALPIGLLSLCNGIFHANPFTWGNALLTHALFAAYMLTALREQPTDLFTLSGLLALMRTVLGSWVAFIDVSRTAFNRQAAAPSQRIRKILLGLLIALPVLFIIVALLMSADAMFGRLTSDFLDSLAGVKWLNAPFIFSFLLVWLYAIGYVILGIRQSHAPISVDYPGIRADVTVCATFLILVNAVFLLFTFIQVAFLFNGGFLQLPEDMVYSQYAREGFFQLLFVTFINFSVIITFMTLLTGVRQSKLLRGLLLALCGFTGVLIGSSFYRMGLYTGAYGHTTLRLCVYTFLTMETVLLAITALKLYNDRVPFIRWFVLTGLFFYVVVNFTGSDYFAAKLNTRLFLSGQLNQIDMGPVGPDGLRVLKPLLEDDAYICVDYTLIPRDQLPERFYDRSEDGWSRRQNYEDFQTERSAHEHHWQNWSFLKR